MASLDPSIILQGRPAQIENPLVLLAQGEQYRAAQTKNKLLDMQLQQEQRAAAEQQALGELTRAAYDPETGNVDPAKIRSGLAQAGNYGALNAFETKQLAQQKAQREADKARLESVMQNVALQGQLLGGVTDQASYDAARQHAAQNGVDVSKLPPTYDPNMVAQLRARALTAAQQVEQEWKQKKYDQDESQFQQTQSTTRRGQDMSAQTAAEGRAVTMRGQDLTDQRARDLNATKAGDSKAAQAQQERVREANDAIGLLDQAEKLIPQATGSYIGAGRDLALRSIGAATDAGNAAAQLRALEGALVSKMPKMSGPQSDKDVAMYRQMAGQIGDPTVPSETKLAAIKTIREIQNKYAGNAPASPAAPAAPAAPVAQDAAIQELRRRAAADPALAAKLKAMGY